MSGPCRRDRGFPWYLRWRYTCLCSSSSWLCKQRRRWQRGGAASRTARGPCTARWCRGRRCSWHGKDWRTPPPRRCSCRSSPSQTWGGTDMDHWDMEEKHFLYVSDEPINRRTLNVKSVWSVICVDVLRREDYTNIFLLNKRKKRCFWSLKKWFKMGQTKKEQNKGGKRRWRDDKDGQERDEGNAKERKLMKRAQVETKIKEISRKMN